MSAEQQCTHEKDDGGRCGVDFALCDCHQMCFHHAPCKAEEREEARKRGGKASGLKKGVKVVDVDQAPDPPRTLDDVATWLSWAALAVATGTVDARTAHELTYTLRALHDVLKTNEQYSDRIEQLQEDLAALKRRGLEAV